LFQSAHDVYPDGLGSLRNLAECQEAVGQFASARRTWLDLKRALLTHESQKYDGWIEDADQASTRLAPKVAKLTVDLTVVGAEGQATSSDGVEVTVNGERLKPSLVGIPLDRDPGRYIVRAGEPGARSPEELVIELSAGEAKRVALRVSAAEQTTRGSATSGDTWKLPTAWVAIGIGAAGAIGATVSLLVRQSARDDLKTQVGSCTPQGDNFLCPKQFQETVQSTVDRGKTATTLVNVFAVIGVVGLGSGITLLATSPSRSTGAALVLSPTSLAAVGRF
jgi:hypothetical protein